MTSRPSDSPPAVSRSAAARPAIHWYAAPWHDRAGHLSPLKIVVFLALFIPALVLAVDAMMGTLGAKPVTAAIHEAGDWALRFLLLSLAVTPLRRFWRWSRLLLVRRMVGLAALAYALLHLLLYIVDQNWRLLTVGLEIVLRYYLLIGFVALAGLVVLGITSTDRATRRLGRSWKRLHKIVYLLALLGVVHFFLQSKIDVTEAVLMAGLYLLLMAWRGADKRGGLLATPVGLAGIAIFTGLATAAVEYGWYALFTGVPAERVLAANLDFSYVIRPAWWVLAVGLAVALVAAGRAGVEFLRRRAPGSAGVARTGIPSDSRSGA